MGGGVIFFGFCVIVVCTLWSQNEVKAGPVPAHDQYDMCTIFKFHKHLSRSTTTAAPTDKPKEAKKSRIELLHDWLQELFELEKEADKKKEEEEDKKKKEEEEKKKDEEKKEKEAKKDEPKGFHNMNELWDGYIKFLTDLYYSF